VDTQELSPADVDRLAQRKAGLKDTLTGLRERVAAAEKDNGARAADLKRSLTEVRDQGSGRGWGRDGDVCATLGSMPLSLSTATLGSGHGVAV